MVLYDEIGKNYCLTRQGDERLVDKIVSILDLKKGESIADIGAGTGNYSNLLAQRGFEIFSIDPSMVMMNQLIKNENTNFIRGIAEDIPLLSKSVDAVIALTSVHHFSNLKKAIEEMSRISKKGKILIFTYDPRVNKDKFWFKDYFPSIWKDVFKEFPTLSRLNKTIKMSTGKESCVINYPLPYDFRDLFPAALWCRPKLFLDKETRNGMSAFSKRDGRTFRFGINELKRDIYSGRWKEKYGQLRELKEFDAGYRFIVLKN